ncbi:MAG: hypothetical protein AAF632_17700 [Bacteroidota bacterium]
MPWQSLTTKDFSRLYTDTKTFATSHFLFATFPFPQEVNSFLIFQEWLFILLFPAFFLV